MTSLAFAPSPPNDFLAFMGEYSARCAARCPAICAVAAKWSFEDLVPGLSDFDTRFVVRDPMTADAWGAMSLAVGEVHTRMCGQYPHWARNLEHLPGVNLTVGEITDPLFFYPEFQQWTFYKGDPQIVSTVQASLAAIAWSARDEQFHLKKFATFCGPYQRGIDPPVNVGPCEGKYPLHSRFMHYFAPPVHSAVCLALRRNVCGKLESLRLARELFPRPQTIDMIFDALAHHYEVPEAYQEPRLTQIERELQGYLDEVWASLEGRATLVQPRRGDNAAAVRAKVNALRVDPLHAFFDAAKFCRLMKGRLLFYAESIEWFESPWLIANELGRIAANFYEKPLAAYAEVRWGEKLPAPGVLARLRGELLTAADCDGMQAFAELARRPLVAGEEREQARAVAEVYDPVLRVIERLKDDLHERSRCAEPAPAAVRRDSSTR